MVSPISFKNQSMNFTPKPVGVVNPNQTSANSGAVNQTEQSDQYQEGTPAALNLRQSPMVQNVQSAGVAATNGVKNLLTYAAATAIGLFALFKTSKFFSATKQVTHIPILDNIIPVTTNKGLKSYLGALKDEAKEFIKLTSRNIKISYFPENYSKEAGKTNFLDHVSDIMTLRKSPERVNDIANGITGSLEAIRRTGSKKGLKITLSKPVEGEKEFLLSHLRANNGIVNPNASGVADVLSNVSQIQSTSKYKGINLVGVDEAGRAESTGIVGWFKKLFE